ncbi:MAG: topoisomerase IV, partial [Oscillospiraceae bacterium]|nr:topoisomerase IV [Oscillospiraceae bacterium]
TDPEKLMQKLYKMTPLMDSYACNFNVLIGGNPMVLGVRELLGEWTAWRSECVKRRVYAELKRKKDKLHKLKGLKKILLDIDRAIAIIRETEEESEVVPNLMIGFGIDEVQAEYVAEIKLRNINKEYIIKRVAETEELVREIEDLEDVLGSKTRIKNIIIKGLEEIIKKYDAPRKTQIIYSDDVEEYNEEETVEDYPVHVFLSRESYFKKITPLSLRMGGEQKYKDNDALRTTFEMTNRGELMFFTDKCQVYKARLSDFADTKASVLGDYLPSKLGMDEGEQVIFMCNPGDYKGHLVFVFENGKVARVELSSYETKTNRKRLTGAYSDKSPIVDIFMIGEDEEFVMYSTENRALIFHTALLAPKTSRSTQGVAVMKLKPKYKVNFVCRKEGSGIKDASRYKVRNLPATGARLTEDERLDEQIFLF